MNKCRRIHNELFHVVVNLLFQLLRILGFQDLYLVSQAKIETPNSTEPVDIRIENPYVFLLL